MFSTTFSIPAVGAQNHRGANEWQTEKEDRACQRNVTWPEESTTTWEARVATQAELALTSSIAGLSINPRCAAAPTTNPNRRKWRWRRVTILIPDSDVCEQFYFHRVRSFPLFVRSFAGFSSPLSEYLTRRLSVRLHVAKTFSPRFSSNYSHAIGMERFLILVYLRRCISNLNLKFIHRQ